MNSYGEVRRRVARVRIVLQKKIYRITDSRHLTGAMADQSTRTEPPVRFTTQGAQHEVCYRYRRSLLLQLCSAERGG